MRTLMTVLALVPVLVGCSQVPKPSAHVMSYQKKMQAAQHWQVLAQDVASQVNQDYASIAGSGIYVEPQSGVFGKAFTSLLKTELIQAGVPLSESAQNAVLLAFDVQLVRHKAEWPDRRDRTQPGLWTAVATGIRVARNVTENMIIPAGVALDLWAGTWTTLPEHEVLITTSLEKDGNCVMRRADLYYVNDRDSGQYVPPLPQGTPGASKTLEVVAQ